MIAFAQIIADFEPVEYIKRCWTSVLPYVDGAYITLNGKKEKETVEAKKLRQQLQDFCKSKGFKQPVFSYTKWVGDFAETRNFNLAQIPQEFEFFLWMDADDVLRGGQNLKKVEELAVKNNFNSVFFNYIYRADITPEGQIKEVLIEHLRERLVKNDGSYKWVAPIHETLVQQKEPRMTDTDQCDVVHMSTDERAGTAIQRNIDILETQLASQGNRQDPRTIYYLAKAYFDLRTKENWDKAEVLILKYLHGSETNTPSGWAEERAQAYEYLYEMYRDWGMFNKAEKAIHNALIEDPRFPGFYIDLALLFVYKRDWAKAKHWVALSQKVSYPKTTLVTNPRDMKVRTLEVMWHIAINTNDLDASHAAALKLAEILPNDKVINDRVLHLTKVKEQNEIGQAIIKVGRYLSDTGQTDRAQYLVHALPREIEEEPVFIDMRHKFLSPRKWEKNTITIMCGKGFEQWSPKNLAKGIGGSEEAVIYLSNELTKLGWKVTVFGDPGMDEGDYNGVYYAPYFKFNPNDIFNILVGWRSVQFFDNEWKSQKNYLWLHDIQNANEYNQHRIDKLTKIFALSPWHRNNMPNVSDDKFMLTGNGINAMDFRYLQAENLPRDPHRIFYGSSYDRGLEHLLKMWPDIRKEVPDATLHVCYGWNLFESFYANNPERMAWKAKMDEMMTQEGITNLGRISQLEVLREQFQSAVWAYPTHFGEISCITAMKSQAAGAIPVVTNYAALDSTVQYGVKVPVKDGEDIYDPDKRKEFSNALIGVLKDEQGQKDTRKAMMEWAQENFAWENVAKQWDEEFKRDPIKEAMDTVLKEKPSVHKFMPAGTQKKYGKKETY